MSNTKKIWIILGACLVVIGLTIFAAVMWAYNWDFSKLSTAKYETSTFNIKDEINNISINTDTADICFAISEENMCKVVCYEQENINYSVVEKDSTLEVKVVDNRKWYEYIGINLGSPRITVYLPKTEYASLYIKEDTGDIEIPKDFKFATVDISLSTGDVKFFASALEAIKIKTGTGKIIAQNLSTDTLNISTSTGDTNITNVTCKNLISTGNTGDISLENVIATEKLSIKRTTGRVKFDASDAAEIFIKTDTGDVKGSLLTEKVFITQTDTGSVHVPKTVTGGKCEITTDTGDIKITVE